MQPAIAALRVERDVKWYPTRPEGLTSSLSTSCAARTDKLNASKPDSKVQKISLEQHSLYPGP